MSTLPEKYRTDIDLCKGLAIIAIVFYHIGLLPLGYLGVEVFLVIGGFLVIPRLYYGVVNNETGVLTWMRRRLFRLWPIVVVASAISLAAGYFVMMPDSYENLSESVVASNLFANNILSAITGRSYWDAVNEYKPLMQMWYLGVVVQSYVVIAVLIYLLSLRRGRRFGRGAAGGALLVVTLLSLGLYLFQPAPLSDKFYLTHFRFWEFSIGGLIGLYFSDFKTSAVVRGMVGTVLLLLLCGLLCYDFAPLSRMQDSIIIIGDESAGNRRGLNEIYTMAAVGLTSLLLVFPVSLSGKVLGAVGRMSLSIFVWHQVILAFYRYTHGEIETAGTLLLYLAVTGIVSLASYYFIERLPIRTRVAKWGLLTSVALVTLTAFFIYLRGGVVRDVPELEITVGDPANNRNTEYIDRVYSWRGPFESSRIHVLIAGNSFARDFACVLSEYDKAGNLELVYVTGLDEADRDVLKDADYIFVFGPRKNVTEKVMEEMKPSCRIFGIGTKSFGKEFGVFYTKRNTPDYFSQSIPGNARCDSINREWRREWGDGNFIDLMEAARLDDGTIMLFTPDNKVISFDCRHLTPAGCRFFASKIDFDHIFHIDTTHNHEDNEAEAQ